MSPPSRLPSSFSTYLSTSTIASKARSALVTAGSYVASTAAQLPTSGSSSSSTSTSSNRSSADNIGKKQTWEEWARDWTDGRKNVIKGYESIHVLPGWAVKKHRAKVKDDEPLPFDLHISTLGFCTFVREPQSASRTQRAFLRIAKTLAALPKLPIPSPGRSRSSSPPSFINSPEPSPSLFRSTTTTTASSSTPPVHPDLLSPRRPVPHRQSTVSSDIAFSDPLQLTLAHDNLDSRLRPFWSNVLPYRRVSLTVSIINLSEPSSSTGPAHKEDGEPLMRTTFTTNAQGHFAHNLVIPWERLCTHPPSIGLAFSHTPSTDISWGLCVKAELLSESGPSRLSRSHSGLTTPQTVESSINRGTAMGNVEEATLHPEAHPLEGANSFFSRNEIPNRGDGDGSHEKGLMGLGSTEVEDSTIFSICDTGGIRVISDLDDTVKHSDILAGPREVFRPLEDICVPGMNTLYDELATTGVSGFHFVSNSPFELYPIISDFLALHQFPKYSSLKLKFYGGRSIVTSLFEPPGERKRPSILEILDAFSRSSFILFGDSGEQDLELYVDIARERPDQIKAIFIRDVTSDRADILKRLPLATSLSSLSLSSSGSGSVTPEEKEKDKEEKWYHRKDEDDSDRSTIHSLDDSKGIAEDYSALTSAQQKILKRAALWDGRVEKAKRDIPSTTLLRFFSDVNEIEELARGLVERMK